MKRSLVLLLSFLTVGLFTSSPAHAAHSTDTFLLIMEAPNVGAAPNGDHIVVTGEGEFSVSPKSVSASGEFVHLDADGNVFVEGTWTATSLISFSFYGCRFIPALGADLGDDNLCGGAVKMGVMLDTPIGELPGMMTVFCIVGPQAPSSHNEPDGEGVTVNVPGIINFNHTVHGENIYVRVS
jgi:hypothetical protein